MPDKVSTRERYGEAFWRRRRHVVTQSVELVRPSNCSLLNNGYPVPPFWRQFANKFIADRQMNAGVDRLSRMKIPPQSALDADPDLKLVSERSPYMRTER